MFLYYFLLLRKVKSCETEGKNYLSTNMPTTFYLYLGKMN